MTGCGVDATIVRVPGPASTVDNALDRAEPLDEGLVWADTSGDVAQRAEERVELAPCQGLGVKGMCDQGPGLVDLLSRHGHGASRGVEDETETILLSAGFKVSMRM